MIGALLGHRSTKTTQRYAYLADHPVRSAADRIATRIADYLDVAPSADPVLRKAIRTKWHDTRAAAVFLQTYRWLGTGPELTKIGLRIVYSLEMLVSSNPTNAEKRLAA